LLLLARFLAYNSPIGGEGRWKGGERKEGMEERGKRLPWMWAGYEPDF